MQQQQQLKRRRRKIVAAWTTGPRDRVCLTGLESLDPL